MTLETEPVMGIARWNIALSFGDYRILKSLNFSC